MARDCEIDDCGVLAVGRCAICRRAFCGSHQAVVPGTSISPSTLLTDRCAPCDATARRDSAAYREANPTPREAARRLIDRAPELFRANGIAPIPLNEEFTERRLVQRLLRKVEEEVVTVTSLGDCWVLGEAPWRVPDSSERGRIDYRTTALVDSATSSRVSRGQIIQAYRRQDRTAVFGTTIGWEGDYIHDRESRNRTGWEIVADLLRLMLPKGAAS